MPWHDFFVLLALACFLVGAFPTVVQINKVNIISLGLFFAGLALFIVH